ncbi:MAG: hypothetical protein K6F21_05590 [Bacteroidales bacterium]|nr:hypothetical protein [Bacteroidales bacterium]
MNTKHILTAILGILMPLGAMAQQQPMTPEEQEKKMLEGIETLVVKYEEDLQLEPWQTFYLDSILVHNYKAMSEESKKLSDNKVANIDLYQHISDKWEEKSYLAIQKVLNPEQWTKYLKMGAGRAKKARDKRAAKKEASKK